MNDCRFSIADCRLDHDMATQNRRGHATRCSIGNWQLTMGNCRSGVILLEVLVALAVFVAAAAVVGAILTRSVQGAVDIRQQNRAANLARSVMVQYLLGQEEMISQSLLAFEAGGKEETLPAGWSAEIETEELLESPGMQRATVIVRSTEPGRPAEHRLTWLMRIPPAAEGEELP